MKSKSFVFLLLGLFMVSCVSAYYCIEEEDNYEVKQFKSNINILSLKQDIQENHMTKDAIILKLKYFVDCR